MFKQLTLMAIGLAAIFQGSAARADYVIYTNRSSFEAAITSEKTETFNELGGNIQAFGATGLNQATGLTQPIAVSGTNSYLLSASSASLAGYYPTNGTYLIGPTSTSSTDGISVSTPVNNFTAVGADVANFASNSLVTITVKTALGLTLISSVAVDGSTPGSSLGFLGVSISTPNDYVTSLTFSAPVGSNQNIVLDNLSFGFTPLAVPEPASMALMALGSLVIGVGAVRNRLGKTIT